MNVARPGCNWRLRGSVPADDTLNPIEDDRDVVEDASRSWMSCGLVFDAY